MSSKAQRILDYAEVLMSAFNEIDIFASNNVFVSVSQEVEAEYRFELRDMPAIALKLGDENELPREFIDSIEHELFLEIVVLSKKDEGVGAFNVGDSAVCEVYSRMKADTSLGGLSLNVEGRGITREADVLERPISKVKLLFLITYQTTPDSLEN